MTAIESATLLAGPPEPTLDLQLLGWLMERIVGGNEASRPRIRVALEQATTKGAGRGELAWHEVALDVWQSLGQRCRVLECTARQMSDLGADGAQLITRFGDGQWLAITQARRGRLLVLRSGSDTSAQWLAPQQLQDILSKAAGSDNICCLAVHPSRPITAYPPAEKPQPLARLWALLKPEWPDIWIVIVFAMIIGLLALATPIAVETLVNTVAFGRFLQPVVILSLLLLTFMAFSGALRALQTFVVEIIQRRLFARVAADIAYRLPRVQAEELEGQSGPELVNRFFDVVIVQKVAAQLLLDGVSLVLGALIGMALLAFYHPWLLGFDVLLLLMIATILFVLGRGAVPSSIKESKIKYRMAGWLEEVAACSTAFRYDGAAQYALERADQLTYDYLTARGNHFRIVMRQIVFALGMQAVASTILLGLGGWLVISGELTLGQLVASELIVAVIVGSFAKLGKHMESFYDLLASVDKLGVLFDLPLEPQDGLAALPMDANDDVELHDVAYRTSLGQQVLRGLSVTIGAGQRLAVQGPSGSGKSTLLDLLFGLKVPTSGQIAMGGVELREFRPAALRGLVALVRDCEVFAGSVSDNVRLGRPYVSIADIRTALADVGLLQDVLHLPKQIDTELTSTGHPMASSQLRRLMLARACAAKPRLLLIDGVLDSLPDDEAKQLMQWLCQPEHPWKLVVVTGRRELAAACHRTLNLARGGSDAQQEVERMNV